MAKGKGKGASGGGPRRTHGPKRHMHRWCGADKSVYAKAGVLSKYNDFESWQLACTARGKKSSSQEEFNKFVVMSLEDKKQYFQNLQK